MNADLMMVFNWSKRNGLSLNSTKSKALVVTRSVMPSYLVPLTLGNDTLDIVKKVQNLGFF